MGRQGGRLDEFNFLGVGGKNGVVEWLCESCCLRSASDLNLLLSHVVSPKRRANSLNARLLVWGIEG